MAFNVIVYHFMVNLETGKEKNKLKVNLGHSLESNGDQREQTMLLILGENDVIYLIELFYAENQIVSFRHTKTF